MISNRGPVVDPDKLQREQDRVNDFAARAAEWVRHGVKTEEDAEKLADFLAGARGLRDQLTLAHTDAKQPYLAAGKEVDKLYGAIMLAADKTIATVRPLMTAWMTAKKAAAEAKQAEERRAAEEALAKACAAMDAATRRVDVVGEAAAQGAAREAQAALKAAQAPVKVQVRSASGGGRTVALHERAVVKIHNLSLAFRYVMGDADVEKAINKAISARVRAKGWNGVDPPGCTVTYKEQAL